MIVVDKLTKSFDGFVALKELSCRIEEGCIYGMVGSNGAGKSTFLRLVNGIYRPDQGTIEIDEQPVYENIEIKKELAFVADDIYFLNGANMNRMKQLYQSVYAHFDEERYQSLVEKFRLDPKKNLAAFSKGMRRQAATILAVSCRPKYLFMDETFDGLDPVMRNLVKNLIYQDVEERKTTAVLTSHSLRELEDTCDQLALLHQGGLVFESDISSMKTSLFKVQLAFREAYDQNSFPEIEILKFTKSGSVANMIVRGKQEQVVSQLASRNPIVLDVLPLTLEEVFTYEMEALGYVFEDAALKE